MSSAPTQPVPPPEQPTEPVAVPAVDPAPPPAQREMTMLREFAAQQGCEAYKADSKKIDLLTTYIWLRQFTEGLTFEMFLRKFTTLADFSETNRKHPLDALKYYCPRQKKAADALGMVQWNAKECVDILVLYTELLGFADADPDFSQDMIANIAQYLRSDGPLYKSGEIPAPMAVPKVKKKRAASAGTPALADPDTGLVPTGKAILPSESGQRVIYTMVDQGGRQQKGVVDKIYQVDERWYVDFATDDGEIVEGRNRDHFAVVDEVAPAPPENVLESQKFWIPKVLFPKVVAALQMTVPMANILDAAIIYPFTVKLDTLTESGHRMSIDVNVVNGGQGPYVEAELCDTEENTALCHLNPRNNITGEYLFPYGAGVIRLYIAPRE